ncbi:DUF4386 domain-containing protein [bacterium]|nr:DUF4386 domain-containing protein [bacterium]
MTSTLDSVSQVKTAKLTGILYLLIIILAGFSEGYVRSTLIVPGDAATTAQNILTSEGLFRLGFVTDLLAFMIDLVVSVLLYVLLAPVNKTLAMVSAALRIVAHPAIASINLLNHFIAIPLLSGSAYIATFSPEQLHALVLLFLDIQNYGYLIGGAFFGLHCLLLGYLIYKSKMIPALIGIFMSIAGVGYLVETFGMILLPGNDAIFTMIVAITAVLGELSLTLWLMIKGVKVAHESI